MFIYARTNDLDIACSRIHRVAINQKLKKRIVHVQIAVTSIIVIGIASRIVEIISSIFNWGGVDRLIREISLFTDLCQSLLIVIAYVLVPLIDAISTARWLAKMEQHSDTLQSTYWKTVSEKKSSISRQNPLIDSGDIELSDISLIEEKKVSRELSLSDVKLNL